jgi:uncharacterized protein (TIGR00645 family)
MTSSCSRQDALHELVIEQGIDRHVIFTGRRDDIPAVTAASIVAISSIHLLKAFMNAQNISNDKLMWYVIIHLTFVLSALGMAYVDRLNRVNGVKPH